MGYRGLWGVYVPRNRACNIRFFPIAGCPNGYGLWCGAIAGSLIGGRLADRLGAKYMAGISLAGLSICFFLLLLALRAGVLVELAIGLSAAVAQLFFPAQQSGLANDFPTRRGAVLAW